MDQTSSPAKFPRNARYRGAADSLAAACFTVLERPIRIQCQLLRFLLWWFDKISLNGIKATSRTAYGPAASRRESYRLTTIPTNYDNSVAECESFGATPLLPRMMLSDFLYSLASSSVTIVFLLGIVVNAPWTTQEHFPFRRRSPGCCCIFSPLSPARAI
jgi:hypothetical protein